MEEEQPLKRAKTEVILDGNADIEDLIVIMKKKIEENSRAESNNTQESSVSKQPHDLFDKQFLQSFSTKTCEVRLNCELHVNDQVFEERSTI